MGESAIMHHAWTAMVEAGAKLWRNSVGVGVVGRMKREGGTVTVYGASTVRFGLCVGSPDLVGYLPVVVTPAMVGTKIALFVGAEAKDTDGCLSPEQGKFIAVAREDGAVCFAFHSVAEALDNLRQQDLRP